MPKGYWIAHVDVQDTETYDKYRAANGAPISAHGGRFVVRGGAHRQAEGALRSRHVVIEFPSYADALACYESAGYQAARAIREAVSTGDLVIIEGYDG